eukprot:1833730-Pleurochrysis_carterae.AAC.2
MSCCMHMRQCLRPRALACDVVISLWWRGAPGCEAKLASKIEPCFALCLCRLLIGARGRRRA